MTRVSGDMASDAPSPPKGGKLKHKRGAKDKEDIKVEERDPDLPRTSFGAQV